ncbi:MAG: Ferrous-iron efflux pump FieF [Candidatus Omnitrophica bacterium ADurb.Bin277]|nr:MAG: Ferrous-iron efflux pump FieF [Candidatus Omnitrophica bacterium ADurb.Bin277]
MPKEGIDLYPNQTRRALRLAIGVAFLLMIVKFVTGLVTHSMAILASALDSMLDMLVSILNFFAFRAASKPPDEEHAYGHGKVESLAGLFQSLFIGVSGSYLVYESVGRFFRGSFVREIPLGIGVIFFSALATWFLSRRLNALAKHNRSLILGAEKAHYAMDFLSYGGVLLALILVGWTGNVFWDLGVSILVALYIFKEAIKIFTHAVSELLDKGLPDTELRQIKRIILEHHPAVVGVHNLRSRIVGNRIFLDFHIEIRGEDDFKKAHHMTESLIAKITDHLPNADVTVHYDPEGE